MSAAVAGMFSYGTWPTEPGLFWRVATSSRSRTASYSSASRRFACASISSASAGSFSSYRAEHRALGDDYSRRSYFSRTIKLTSVPE
jgi:hypothetical protein